MNLPDLASAARDDAGALSYAIPETWMQGRTVYGGVTAALSLHTARLSTGESRALRSAMINFVGPASGDLRIEAELLRRGRNVSAVRTRASSAGAASADCVFTFADQRASALDLQQGLACPAPRPPADFTAPAMPEGVPRFMRQFELSLAEGGWPFTGGAPEQTIWVRFADPDTRRHPLGLIALADTLAPAVAGALSEPAPLSSMTWMIDMLVDDPQTDDGWWLLQSKADHARGGFSTQDMTIWNAQGDPVAKGRQMVAVFA